MQTEHSPKRSKLKGCLQILARGLMGIVALIVILAVVGYVYEHYAPLHHVRCLIGTATQCSACVGATQRVGGLSRAPLGVELWIITRDLMIS
jgi:hypothetical protein